MKQNSNKNVLLDKKETGHMLTSEVLTRIKPF
jgi:hypothetical protein